MKKVRPYSILAEGYDFVMRHVDYADWVRYVHDIIQDFRPGAQRVLELGCGTGTMGFELVQRASYTYVGIDRSPEMIAIARRKARAAGAPLTFQVDDFLALQYDEDVDVVLLLYDGLNYVTSSAQLDSVLSCALRVLRPNGLFLFDQSTPANSLNNASFFEDRGSADGLRYHRSNVYDEELRLHRTTFELRVNGDTFVEEHLQRAYELDEIRTAVRRSAFEPEAVFEGFSRKPAGPNAERIQWVLRRHD